MRRIPHLAGAVLSTLALSGSGAWAANMCKADTLSCPTAMPVGGYCECTAHGTTQSGTVVDKPAPHTKTNSTAGGCGAHPGAPGCG